MNYNCEFDENAKLDGMHAIIIQDYVNVDLLKVNNNIFGCFEIV